MGVLEHLHGLGREFFQVERDAVVKDFLAHALLGQFVSDAVDPIRRMLLGEDENLTPDEMDLRHRLVAACTVMGATFPEYEQWYGDAVENAWGWVGVERGRIRENFREDVEAPSIIAAQTGFSADPQLSCSVLMQEPDLVAGQPVGHGKADGLCAIVVAQASALGVKQPAQAQPQSPLPVLAQAAGGARLSVV